MNRVNAVKRLALAVGVSAKTAASEVAVLVRKPAVLGLTGLVAAGASHAEVIDVSAIVTTITGGVTAISAIGVAVISLVVVIKLYKWVQRVL